MTAPSVPRVDGEPVRIARSQREAFPADWVESAAGIDGPPEPMPRGWRALLSDLWAWFKAPTPF